jgi:hypothetical protein
MRDFLHKFVIVYLDDVCVYNRTVDEHLEHLRLVLQRFKEESLKLRLKSASSVFKRRSTWAIVCKLVKFMFRQGKSRPLQTGQRRRRKRRFVVSCNYATRAQSPSIVLATLRLH